MSSVLDSVLKRRDEAMGKAFELMALISAGSFAAMLSVRKDNPSILVTIALLSSITNIFSVVAWYFANSKKYSLLASDVLDNSRRVNERSLSPFGQFMFYLSTLTFIVTCGTFLFIILG